MNETEWLLVLAVIIGLMVAGVIWLLIEVLTQIHIVKIMIDDLEVPRKQVKKRE
jgi:hypothetical protein